ncbi:hypothetical protein DICSQDRAFT_160677 [Dichomitus squalens LYAD-421 SS1]|uniref:uncharacterized protein n=1 Tax=Dichomitus squalens (strain LYAD-421) TaxID=732165 RepID=UPI0004411048|nr:uncharacterized protein DICSQDRAFT_160677 [Dichomitus squalens LYAD-421 SS1]EJF62826.1 hypothetical protein DICSQDRAFT_160677 [Dichomitus squalens LYAD-421 SS1]
MTLAEPLPTPPATMADLWSLQTELSSLMAAVRRIQDSARQATQAADDKVRKLQSKVEELEADNLARELEIRRLDLEKTELQRELEARRPDLAAAIASRDAAVKRLDHSLKVIEDLVHDREQANVRTGANTNNANRDRSKANGQPTTVSAPVPMHPKRGTPVESDEESTVRPQRSASSMAIRTTRTSPTSKPESTKMKRSPSSAAASQQPAVDNSGVRALEASKGQPDPGPRKKQVPWYLEFSKRPATSEVWHGPIPYDDLAVHLVLDQSIEDDLQHMELMTGYDTRMHAVDTNLVFIYRPVILEGLTGTYLIGWGDGDMVCNVKAWAKTAGDCHLFFYPAVELEQNAGWYYVGLHSLSYASVDPVWHKLSKDDKRRLLVELQDRNDGMDVGQFKRDVKEGRLQQCCVQIESRGTKAESYEFLRQNGLLEG